MSLRTAASGPKAAIDERLETITIHFGGDPEQPNFLPVVPGWNYIVRLYRPRTEILDGSWTFPKPKPIEEVFIFKEKDK